MKIKIAWKQGWVAALLALLLVVGACADDDDTVEQRAAALGAAPVTLDSITITAAGGSFILPGDTNAFTATGNYSDASTADLTASVTWSTDNAPVATVTVAGVVTGVSVGSAGITATDLGTGTNATYTEYVATDWFASEPTSYDFTSSATYTFTNKFTPSSNLLLHAVRYLYGDTLVLYDSGGTLIWSVAVNVASPNVVWQQYDLSSPIALASGSDYYLGIYVNGNFQGLTGGWPTFTFAHGTVDTTSTPYNDVDAFPAFTDVDYWSYVNPVYSN